jgi:hypothetical protein
MTVENMLNTMSADELNYWHAFSELEHEKAEWESMKRGG